MPADSCIHPCFSSLKMPLSLALYNPHAPPIRKWGRLKSVFRLFIPLCVLPILLDTGAPWNLAQFALKEIRCFWLQYLRNTLRDFKKKKWMSPSLDFGGQGQIYTLIIQMVIRLIFIKMCIMIRCLGDDLWYPKSQRSTLLHHHNVMHHFSGHYSTA